MLELDQLARNNGPVNNRPLLSIVTPAYNEADNLPVLYERLSQVLDAMDLDWEWVIIDDHSEDGTFEVIKDMGEKDPRVHGIRFARNFGSHTALTCGLLQAKGDCAVAMAADLQDPPEVLPALLTKWHEGKQVVWAVRENREGEKRGTLVFARLYYFLMRRFVGLKEIPATGADFFLLDREVLDALGQFNEKNVSIMVLIAWMGFRQASVSYTKQARLHGCSGWSLEKKLKMGWDSITSFSYLPIRLMSYLGFIIALFGFIYAGIVVSNSLIGNPASGWSSLIVVVLLLSGIQMVMIGVLGEYLWRALDESRHRPRYLIEATTKTPEHSRTGAFRV